MILKYIGELLEKNNRVIIPDFGAFLKGSGSSRSTFFNEFIKVDDGLLVNYVVEKKKISKDDAIHEIAEFINEIKDELSEKKEFTIAGIGVLSKDEKGRIKLTADEKAESKVVAEKPPKKVEKEKKIETEKKLKKEKEIPLPVSKKSNEKPNTMKNQPVEKKENTPKKEEKKNNKVLIILLIVIPLIAIIVAGYFYQDEIFGNKAKEEAAKIELAKKIEKEKQVATLAKEKAAKELKEKEEAEKVEIVEVQKELEIKNQKFYLVGGVFKEVQNAKDLLSELEYEGFSDVEFIEVDGLNYLCYNSFKSFSKAKTKLQNIKEEGYEVWILKH